jgi:hypothetical protein
MAGRWGKVLGLWVVFQLMAGVSWRATGEERRGLEVEDRLEALSKVRIGVYRGLVIGIDNYEDDKIPDLQTAVNDARDVAALLRGQYGFSAVKLLLDQQADGSSIVQALRQLAENAMEDDSVLIYFAGHGEVN